MKTWFAVLSISILSLSALFFYTWYRLHVRLNFHAQNSDTSFPVGLHAETEFVTTSDGQKIAYWYFPVENAKAIIILSHGYNNPGGKPQMLGHAEYLKRSGYSTVLLDLRSYGESDGNKMSLGVNEWKDVEAVYDHIKTLPEAKDKKIGLFGVSMGGTTMLVTAGKTGKGDFVIASVPYADFESLFRFQIKANGLAPEIFYPLMRLAAKIELGSDFEKYTPTAVMKDIHVPVFLISAKHDEELNGMDAKALYDLANEPKEYWEANSGHDVFYTYPLEFQAKMLGFLGKQTDTK